MIFKGFWNHIMNILREASFGSLLIATLALVGCGSDSGIQPEKTVPVSGIVTYRGKPLPGYLVTFSPVVGRRNAGAMTDQEGRFVLGTNKEGDGCPPGRCRIAVRWGGLPPEEPGQEVLIDDPRLLQKQPINLPPKYEEPNTSGLEVEVPPSGLSDYKLDLL